MIVWLARANSRNMSKKQNSFILSPLLNAPIFIYLFICFLQFCVFEISFLSVKLYKKITIEKHGYTFHIPLKINAQVRRANKTNK